MKYLGLILAFLVAVSATAKFSSRLVSTIEDLPDSLTSRIIDGEPAVEGQLPWQVAIQSWLDGFRQNLCGGSLITRQWVMTAAHCLDKVEMTRVYVGYVMLDAAIGPDTVKVWTSNMFMHPSYNKNNFHNDIGLIKLPQEVVLNERISVIGLPHSDYHIPDGANVTVSGWGRTMDGWNAPQSNVLNFVTLTTITNTECQATFGSRFITNATVCAIGHPNHSTCQMDSGGPLVAFDEEGTPYQVGIVSFVWSQGCTLGRPSAYLRPEYYLAWIKDIIDAN